MTEAELLATFHDYLEQVHTILFGYISFISGFLIMSYLVANKLSRRLTVLVLGLFSLTCCSLIFRLYLVRKDFVMLDQYILHGMQSGELNLPWFGTVPHWAPALLAVLDIGVTFGGFVGSVAFFIFQRRQSAAEARKGLPAANQG